MIPQEFIDELLSRIDIVEIIEPRVTLKKAGKDYLGLCPFHDEKTPSFTVSQDKQFYYCFGCQARGTALEFLKQIEHLDFIPAIEMLAARVGMEVPRQSQSGRVNQQRDTIYEILDKAAAFYREQLKTHPQRDRAVNYLRGRGLSGAIARDFGLGYAPPGWDNLQSSMADDSENHNLLIQSGMLTENNDQDSAYDRFRDRVMFPIRDIRGRTIAFGGRVMGDDKPKYLNSPETPVFHKGRELYGLYEARRRTRNLEQIVVVEGYMDVVALAQHNINYSVATLGTATSSGHIERLYRLVSKIVFCFDGDTAGRSAAWKAMDTVLEFMQDGRFAAFLFLPEGEDPDTLVRQEGRDRFELRLSRATPLTEFFFSRLESSLDMKTPEGKAALSKSAIPMIQRIPDGVFKQLMIDELSTRTGLSTDRLLSASSQYPGNRKRGDSERAYSFTRGTPHIPGEPYKPGEQEIAQIENAVSMLLQQPELASRFTEADYSRLRDDQNCRLLIELMELILQSGDIKPAELVHAYHDKSRTGYLESLLSREHILDVSEFHGEFSGILRSRLAKLDKRAEQESHRKLLDKPYSSLSASEREKIKDHPRKKR